MTTETAQNGAAPPEVRKVVFATNDPAPPKPPELPRLPRDGEPLGDYVTAVARNLGHLKPDAALSAEMKRRYTEELFERAEADELFGGSRDGKTFLAARTAWERMNPEIAGEIGKLGARSRDLAGRATRGPARAIAALLEALTEDPERTLSPCEAELLRSMCPEVATERDTAAQARTEHAERIIAAVNRGQIDYPAGQPGLPVAHVEPMHEEAPS